MLFILVFKFQTQYNQQLNQKIKISAETLYTDQNKILDDVKQVVLSGNHHEISSLENVRPGIRPLFFNQNILQKAPEKNIPSTEFNHEFNFYVWPGRSRSK